MVFGTPQNQGKHKMSDSGRYYFVPRQPGVTNSVADVGDAGREFEAKPAVDDDAFTPKAVNRKVERGNSLASVDSAHMSSRSVMKTKQPAKYGQANVLSRGLMKVFGGGKEVTPKESEAAKKINPKVFFSAERTFLAWMQASISVAAISIALGSFETGGEGLRAWASLFFSAVAIAFTIYALLQYAKRSLMIVRRSPGPWEDKKGPMVIGSLFVLSLSAQFCIYMASYIAHSKK